MIRLYDTGAYLVHGTDIIADDRDAAAKLKQAVGGHFFGDFGELRRVFERHRA